MSTRKLTKLVLGLIAATVGEAVAQPSMPGYRIETYAELDAPQDMSFDATGVLWAIIHLRTAVAMRPTEPNTGDPSMSSYDVLKQRWRGLSNDGKATTRFNDETLAPGRFCVHIHDEGHSGPCGSSIETTGFFEDAKDPLAYYANRTGKVDCWQNSEQKHRWLATAVLDIEPRLRKVRGYRHLPHLRAALQSMLKIRRVEVA